MSVTETNICPLLTAVLNGNIETAEELYNKGTAITALIQYRNPESGGTVLTETVRKNDIKSLQFLLMPAITKELYDVPDGAGCTPAFLAASLGHVDILFKVFRVTENALLGFQNNKSRQVLLVYTANIGSLAGMRALLRLRNVRESFEKSLVLQRNTIAVSLQSGNIEMLKLLCELCNMTNSLRNYFDPSFGETSLSASVRGGSLECVKFLLEFKEIRALMEVPDAEGMTPLVRAVSLQKNDIAKELIAQGAAISRLTTYHDILSNSLLLTSVKQKKLTAIEFLLSHIKPQDFMLSLEDAIFSVVVDNNAELLKLLLRHHPNIAELATACNSERYSLLELAIIHQSVLALSLLLRFPEFRAKINEKVSSGETPLVFALSLTNSGMSIDLEHITLLIQHGASLKEYFAYRNREGDSILGIAVQLGQATSVQFFLNQEGSRQFVNEKNENGQTPLMHAIVQSKAEVIQLLLEAGATLELCKMEKPILYYPVLARNVEATKILIKAGASVSELAKYQNSTGDSILAELGSSEYESSPAKIIDLLFEYPEFVALIDVPNNANVVPILHAILSDSLHEDMVIKLIQKGASLKPLLEYRNLQNYSILYRILDIENTTLLKFLLQSEDFRKLVHEKGPDDEYPVVHVALQEKSNCSPELLKILVEVGGAKLDTLFSFESETTGNTLLFHQEESDSQLIAYLLRQPAARKIIHHRNHDKKTAIESAILKGTIEVVKLFVELGGDLRPLLNFSGENKITILAQVLMSNRDPANIIKILEYLLSFPEFRSLLSSVDAQGRSILTTVLLNFPEESLNECMNLLLNQGANLEHCLQDKNDQGNFWVLDYIIHHNHKSLKYLASSPIALTFLKMVDKKGRNVMRIALEHQNYSLVRILLEHARLSDDNYNKYLLQVILNFRNEKGETILAIPTENVADGLNIANSLLLSFRSFLRFILSFKALQPLMQAANKSDKTKSSKTIMQQFINSHRFDLVHILLEFGADIKPLIEYRSYKGNHILLTIMEHEDDDAADILLLRSEVRALQNTANAEGLTPIMAAAIHSKVRSFKLLRLLGVSIVGLAAYRFPNGHSIIGASIESDCSSDNDNANMIHHLLRIAEFPVLLEFQTKNVKLPLIRAVERGMPKTAKCLLEMGASVQSLVDCELEGDTVLCWPARRGKIALLRFLLTIPALKAIMSAGNTRGDTPIFLAALHGQHKCFKLLLESGASREVLWTYKFQNGDNLLVENSRYCKLIRDERDSDEEESDTSSYRHTRISKEFINIPEIRAQVSLKSHDGYTPLQLAVLAACKFNVKQLLKFGATIAELLSYRSTNQQRNILHELIKKQFNEEILKDFLKFLFETYPELKPLLGIPDSNGLNPIAYAVVKNNVSSLSAICANLNPPYKELTNIVLDNGHNILSKAVELKLPDMVEYIYYLHDTLRNLADMPNKLGHTAKMLAIMLDTKPIQDHFNIEPLDFLEYRTEYCVTTILAEAARYGYIDGVRSLLKIENFKALINYKDKMQQAALFLAAANGHKAIVQLLIDNGAVSLKELAEQRDVSGRSVVAFATLGSVAGLNFLLNLDEFKHLLNAPDSEGNVPIKLAMIYNRCDALKILLHAGARIDIKNKVGIPAIQYVPPPGTTIVPPDIAAVLRAVNSYINLNAERPIFRALSSDEIGDELSTCLQNGASVNIRTVQGNTLLHLATLSGNYILLRELAKRGADLSAKNDDGKTALILATEITDAPKRALSLCTLLCIEADKVFESIQASVRAEAVLDKKEIEKIQTENAVRQNLYKNYETLIRGAIEASQEIHDASYLGNFCIELAKRIKEELELKRIFKMEMVCELFARVPETSLYYFEAQYELANLFYTEYEASRTLTVVDTDVDADAESKQKGEDMSLLDQAFLHACNADHYPDADNLRAKIKQTFEGGNYIKGREIVGKQIDLLNPEHSDSFFKEFLTTVKPLYVEKQNLKETLHNRRATIRELEQEIAQLQQELAEPPESEDTEAPKLVEASETEVPKLAEAEATTENPISNSRKRKTLTSDDSGSATEHAGERSEEDEKSDKDVSSSDFERPLKKACAESGTRRDEVEVQAEMKAEADARQIEVKVEAETRQDETKTEMAIDAAPKEPQRPLLFTNVLQITPALAPQQSSGRGTKRNAVQAGLTAREELAAKEEDTEGTEDKKDKDKSKHPRQSNVREQQRFI